MLTALALLALIQETPLRIVCFGDSTTAYRTNIEQVYSDRLPELLSRQGIEALTFNAGVGGNTTENARKRFDRDILRRDADVVVIQFGINDSAIDVKDGKTKPRVSKEDYRSNLSYFIDQVRSAGGSPILMTPNPCWWSPNIKSIYGKPPYNTDDFWGFNLLNAEYAQVVRDLAAKKSVPLIDVYSMYSKLQRDDTKAMQKMMPDGIHPLDEGQARVAEVLAEYLSGAIRSGAIKPKLRNEPKSGSKSVRIFGKSMNKTLGNWQIREDWIEGKGLTNRLWSPVIPGSGDFSINARVRLIGQKNSGSAFWLGDNVFGFEGASGTVFVRGPLFGSLQLRQKSQLVIPRDEWFDMEISASGASVTCSINGSPVFDSPYDGKGFAQIGFEPNRATAQIKSWTLSGNVKNLSQSSIELLTGQGMPKAYTIPIVDLDKRPEFHVVVDREKGQYLGHPTTVLLEDGKTILTVYPKGHGKGGIVYKKSVDGGKTWSERLPTPENWLTSREVPTIHRVIDPNTGKKRLIMWSGLYPARLAVSENDGETWSPLKKVGDWGGIVVMGFVEQLKNGDYLAMFHDDGRFFTADGKVTPTFRLYKTFSKDGGMTWSQPDEVWSGSEINLCEPGVIRSPDGNTMAVLLRENARVRNSYVIFSKDEGQTWTNPRELSASLTGDRHTGKYAPDGRLFISFRDTTHISPTKGDWVGWVGTWDDIVNGKEGQYRVRLKDNLVSGDTAYPGVELLPDGTFVTTTYGHWDEGEEPYIRTVRFKMEDLDRIASEAPKFYDVFSDGDNGVRDYRIPSMITTKNGVVLAAADARVLRAGDLPNNIDGHMRRSTDNGKTWKPVQILYNWPGNEGAGDMQMLQDRDTERVFCVSTYGREGVGLSGFKVKQGLGYDSFRTMLQYSDDDGATWSFPDDITLQFKKPEWFAQWMAPGNGIQHSSGRLLMPISIAAPDKVHEMFVIYSDDHGDTLQLSNSVGRKVNEGQIVELNDGRIMMNMRTQDINLRRVSYSSDRGITWTTTIEDKALVEPRCQGSIITYGDYILFSNPASTKRENMTVRLSTDGGKTWPYSKSIWAGPAAYSNLSVLPDGMIGLFFERGQTQTDQQLTFTKFSLEWLTDGKIKTPS